MLYFTHRNTCASKQEERRTRIASLDPLYHTPLSPYEREILAAPIATAVSNVQSGTWTPLELLHAYSKQAIKAHEATNCLTEILIPSAEKWSTTCNTSGPLAGIPLSLKDTGGVAGYDACIGYAAWAHKPLKDDSALVRLLKDAGALPFVKTGVPTTLLSFESFSDVWGRVRNPHNPAFSPGGSTGGEAALLAYGGSRIGVGTDVAGSVRVPAHYSGVYTIRASMHRFLKTGNPTSIPGQIGVPAVYSPMTRTLDDLETFWKAVIGMKPWEYDHSCVPIPWRPQDLTTKKLRWGVMWDDGVVPPSPACRRALVEVVDALRAEGHEVVDFNPPSPFEGLKIAAQLLLADGCDICTAPITFFESNDPGVALLRRVILLPSPIRWLYSLYTHYIKRDPLTAELIRVTSRKSVVEYYDLVAQREGYRKRWFEAWNAVGADGGKLEEGAGLDFLLTVPNALPAVPHGGMWDTVAACGYTFLFNLLDYTAGVLPITRVSALLDALPANHPNSLDSHLYIPSNSILNPSTNPSMPNAHSPKTADPSAKSTARPAIPNAVARRAYKLYDPVRMAGLPVGVQVVGRRLEEEKVLEGMKIVQGAMERAGRGYALLEVD